MTFDEFRRILRDFPLVASVQASEGAATANATVLLAMAQASLSEGVRVLRVEGSECIRTIREATGAPTIGLVKRRYPASDVYITPTAREIDELLETGCEVVALDATSRARPGRADLSDLVARAHAVGRIVLGDCDSVKSVGFALAAGVDMISTTLGGYTDARPSTDGPDLGLLRAALVLSDRPVLAEGRFGQPWQAAVAMRIGAAGVVVGGALNDPVKQTRSFAASVRHRSGRVGAVDIGGTWLRFGAFSSAWELLEERRVHLPQNHSARLKWIGRLLQEFEVERVGVSCGGTVDPCSGIVLEAKAIIPDLVGRSLIDLPVPAIALNDGLASAWAHACHPDFAGKRVATLALGTGVGCGFVGDHRLVMGPRGQYPRLNDLPGPDGENYEALLGGAALTSSPNAGQIARALLAAKTAVRTLIGLYMPDAIVLCGGVGLSPWLDVAELHAPEGPSFKAVEIVPTPFGPNAGLYGAAAVALFPPELPVSV